MLAGDVPKRLVEARKRSHQHWAAAEEGRAINMLPVVLDPQRILADQIIGQLLDGGNSASGLALQRGLAPADQAIIGGDLHQPRTNPWKELFDAGDSHTYSSLCGAKARPFVVLQGQLLYCIRVRLRGF